MASTQKKQVVLDALKNQYEALSLPEIMALLPAGHAERSVRRWLAELVEEGAVIKSGRKRGTRYRISRPRPEQAGSQAAPVFGEASLAAITYIRQPLFRREPVSYDWKWFEAYQPDRSSYFEPDELKLLAEKGLRDDGQEPAGTYARRIYNRLLIDLSYHSSRLEGNTYSLIDTERLLIEGTGAQGKLDEEKVMILNHKEAIRHLVDSAPRLEVSYDEICTLHYLLSDGLVPAEYSGKIRDHGVRVGGSTYVPLEGRERLDRQLRAIAAKAAAISNPHEQSLFLLIHIAYLQAFTDVNKRTSRLGANIPLLKHNLVPLSFNFIEKDDYASAMIAIYELTDVRPLVDLYFKSYLRTCREYDATVEAIGFDAVRVRYRQQRRQVIADVIARQLTGEPLNEYISQKAGQEIPEEHREEFLEDVREDLNEISPQRIAGLGISRQQLECWLARKK